MISECRLGATIAGALTGPTCTQQSSVACRYVERGGAHRRGRTPLKCNVLNQKKKK